MREETAAAQKTFWADPDVKPIWVTIVSAGILVGLFLLHQRLVPNIEEDIYIIFYNASSFFGISFVVVALAALRPPSRRLPQLFFKTAVGQLGSAFCYLVHVHWRTGLH